MLCVYEGILHDSEELKNDSESRKGLKGLLAGLAFSTIDRHSASSKDASRDDTQAYVRLFQERFAAVNNDIVLSNTRVARGPITWKVCVTNKYFAEFVLECLVVI